METSSSKFSAIEKLMRCAAEGKHCSINPTSDLNLRLITSYSASEIDQLALNELFIYLEKTYDLEIEISSGGAGCTFINSNIRSNSRVSIDAARILDDQIVQKYLESAGFEFAAIVSPSGVVAIQRFLLKRVFFITNRDSSLECNFGETLRFGTFTVSGFRSTKTQDDSSAKNGILISIWRKLAHLLRGDLNSTHSIEDLTWLEDADEFSGLLSMRGGQNYNLLLYVHGYNNTFKKAGVDLAKLSEKANFHQTNTIPLLFSWPSFGKTANYLRDVENAKKSHPALLDALRICTINSTTNVLAHSHGATLLVDALSLAESDLSQYKKPPIDELILVAPDIGIDVFSQRSARIAKNCNRSTLYFSKHDIALSFSRQLWGDGRLGDSGDQLSVVQENMDIVDVSTANSRDAVEHSHHIWIPEVAYDIAAVLHGKRSDERGAWLREASEGSRLFNLVPANTVY